jgi:PAS domain S-box-containing protein
MKDEAGTQRSEAAPKKNLLTRLRKIVARLFTAGGAAQEPREHEILYQRYVELEAEMERRKKITDQLLLLQRINNAVNTGMPLGEVLQVAADGIKEVFGYAACDIFLLDEEKENLIYTTLSIDSRIVRQVERVTGLTIIGHKIPLYDGSPFTEMVEKRKTFITTDMVKYFEAFTDSKALKRLAGEVARIVGFRSVMRVPLVAEEEVVGTVGVAGNREFTREDVSALERFASQMAVAIRKKQIEDALRESEERYRGLVERASDTILTLEDSRVTSLNPAFEEFSGFRREKWLGRDFRQLICPEDRGVVSAAFKRVLNGEETSNIEIRLITADGGFKWGELSARSYEREGKAVGVLCIIRDIAERKRVEEEVKRRLMRFRLKDGKVYLARESSTVVSIEAFSDLLKVGYRGLVVSHTPEMEFKAAFPGSYEFVWLAEMADDAMPPELEEIERYLKGLPRKNAVFIDRLDYLIFKNGFERTLTFVQRIREIAYLGSHIVIISLDPATLDEAEMRLLEKETWGIEPMHKEVLSEELLEVLAYIYRQNSHGKRPSYKDIGKGLNISKPTVHKRVRALVSMGYIKETVKGNRKEVEVLDRGRAMFLK